MRFRQRLHGNMPQTMIATALDLLLKRLPSYATRDGGSTTFEAALNQNRRRHKRTTSMRQPPPSVHNIKAMLGLLFVNLDFKASPAGRAYRVA